MNSTVAEELNHKNTNEYDQNIFMEIAKIRSDGKRP